MNRITILFICTGNICRSPMAEAYFNHLCHLNNLEHAVAESAGIQTCDGLAMSPPARDVLLSQGITVDDAFVSRVLGMEIAANASRIVTMTHYHKYLVDLTYPDFENKTSTLLAVVDSDDDVADPYGEPIVAYQQCFDLMKPAVLTLFERVVDGSKAASPPAKGSEFKGPGSARK